MPFIQMRPTFETQLPYSKEEVLRRIGVIYRVLAFSALFAFVFTSSFWMMGQSTCFGLAGILALAGIGILQLVCNW